MHKNLAVSMCASMISRWHFSIARAARFCCAPAGIGGDRLPVLQTLACWSAIWVGQRRWARRLGQTTVRVFLLALLLFFDLLSLWRVWFGIGVWVHWNPFLKLWVPIFRLVLLKFFQRYHSLPLG